MTGEQAINAAFDKVVAHLREKRDEFIKDLAENPDNYEGFDKYDAFVWFIESF